MYTCVEGYALLRIACVCLVALTLGLWTVLLYAPCIFCVHVALLGVRLQLELLVANDVCSLCNKSSLSFF
jgi:hypothetical protein